ncbi:electron transfer flavoprotein subunit beta [Breoghania sp.]|uniref:electron transfer flavoprotein subunit beta n=1 Tax=Breoghania sp. TaxID=2065378 RepID=UPI002614BA74|nr:electron transfer flavoprotein subunit beta [Breoghania sp.]MDJ0933001.1 electron transfer flavoprotein subunit beta [Breoghania sp.]
MIKVAVLLSLVLHPASGLARCAGLDARALELALRMPGAEIHAVHAGDPEAPALRDYLGMGLESLTVLACSAGCDPVPALIARFREIKPNLVLTGMRAEAGEQSGMVPYLISEALGTSLLCDAADVACEGETARVVQALSHGRRREVSVRLPSVLLVNEAGPVPRAPAFAKARRGQILSFAASNPDDAFLAASEMHPWWARPKRMAMPGGGSALERMKAMTEAKAGEGRLLVGPQPEEAAAAIL